MERSSLEFQQEVLLDCLEEMKPLLEEHYKEVAMYQEHIKLNPDYERYQAIEQAGNLVIYTAREDGKLVGYAVFFLNEHLHYKDHTYAANDVLYIDPDYRHSDLAPNFLAYVETELHLDGISVVTYHMKTFKTFETLMDYLDYDKAEFLFSKYIWQ